MVKVKFKKNLIEREGFAGPKKGLREKSHLFSSSDVKKIQIKYFSINFTIYKFPPYF